MSSLTTGVTRAGAPEGDELCSIVLEDLNITGASWLTSLSSLVFVSGAELLDWSAEREGPKDRKNSK